MRQGQKVPTEIVEQIVQIATDDPTMANTVIAKMFDVSDAKVGQIRKKYNIPNPRIRQRSDGKTTSVRIPVSEFPVVYNETMAALQKLPMTEDSTESLAFVRDVLRSV